VGISGTTIGASTDINGRYILNNLKPGKYKLVFRYIGYQTKEVTDVLVEDGKVTTLNAILDPTEGQKLSEVVVTATYKQENISALYAQQKNSAVISDGISAEIIKRSPDKNTGEVLKRVSGTTIQDNKFVVIRGLSDRYNTAMLDGSSLPSTEPNRKAFSFDIVPSNLIDNVIISKTATPDLPADFAGGSIQIVTKDIPDATFLTVGFGTGYNSQSTFKDYFTGYRNGLDYLGFDNGSRQLPSTFPNTTDVILGLGNRNVPSINSLNNNFGITSHGALPSFNGQLTYGYVKDIGKNKNRFGSTFSVSYRNSENIISDITRKYFTYDYTDDQYKFTTNLGLLANFAYTYNASKITFKNLYNRIFDDQFTFRTGSNVSTTSNDNRFYAFDLLQKGLFKSNVEGQHQLGKSKAKIVWNIGYNNIINNQPDQRKVNFVQNAAGDPYVASVTTLGKENTRLFSDLKENIVSASVDYSKPIELFGKSNMKFGVNSQYRNRTFDARFIGLLINTNKTGANEVRTRPLINLFGPDVLNGGFYDLGEISNFNDRYSANSYTNSGYFMLDTKFTEKFRAVYGIRAEKFDLDLSTKDFLQKQPQATLNNLDILPSANLTYSLSPKANFRFSYYRTLARPEFRELAPFSYFDYEEILTVDGNPNIKRALIDNADIRYELYPAAGQVFSVSAFYKNFTNAIESVVDDKNSTPRKTYFNSKNAYVFGFELEARRTLEFLSDKPFFKNTTAYANLSLSQSKVTNTDLTITFDTDRPLTGQSPYVINAGLQYSALENKLYLNFLYNRIGRRLYSVGGVKLGNIYENPRDVFDAQIGLRIFKSKGELKLSASDIFNQYYTFYYDNDKNKKFELNSTDESFKRYITGRGVSLGITYNFK
jgi:TonB-dependent receptor